MHDDYMTTQETADFLGVKRHTVEKWRKKGWLMPDAIGHGKNGRGGVYYYSKEHVLQLASVYRKKNCNHTATTSATLRSATEEKTNTATTSATLRSATEEKTNTATIPVHQKWRKKGWLMPDAIGHGKNGRGGVYYYSKERILQLASVYKSKSCSVPYAMCTEQQNCDQTATTSATLRSATEEKTNTATVPVHQDDKQSCSSQLANFFNQLYGKIPAPNFVYLITFKNGIETYSFSIADETQIEAMAQEAIKLANNGFDVWHAVNPVSIEPTVGKRGDEFAVSYQTAIVVDIDIRSDAHKGDQSLLAANFDEAKSFLPFTPSLIIFSGYGLHAYYIFNQPIKITDDNREELKRRNNLLLDIIRQRANGKKIDGVGDLPRVLRTPCTFNYKLGADNAPMCHIVEDSGLRFTPNEIDEKLSSYSTNQDFDSYTQRYRTFQRYESKIKRIPYRSNFDSYTQRYRTFQRYESKIKRIPYRANFDSYTQRRQRL